MSKKTKILIIEDDEFVRSAYAEKFRLEGYEIDTASDGKEGFEKAASMQPDYILLDILMPNLDGIGFLKQYKQTNQQNKSKIVIFSNISDDKIIQEATKLGADAFLIKSNLTPKDMIDKIKESFS